MKENTDYKVFSPAERLKLFGSEDAGREDKARLAEYYLKKPEFEAVADNNIGFYIVTGAKGSGKTAMLNMAYKESERQDIVPLIIRLDALAEQYSDILKSENLYELKMFWKKSIGKMVIMSFVSPFDFKRGEDCAKAMQWAYDEGYQSPNFIVQAAQIIQNIYNKYMSPARTFKEKGEYKILERLIKNHKIALFLDDFEIDWEGREADVNRIKSLILALSEMTADIEGLSARIALRLDVYEMIRQEEFSDRFETATVQCQWTNDDIMKALAKRIYTYFKPGFYKAGEDLFSGLTVPDQMETYLKCIFNIRMKKNPTKCDDWTLYDIFNWFIRCNPRDMVKLCHAAAGEAYSKKIPGITVECFAAVLKQYSTNRYQDLINEYKHQMPALKDVMPLIGPAKDTLKNAAQQKGIHRYTHYSANQLRGKILEAQKKVSIELYQPYSGRLEPVADKQIACFLYKIGFLIGRAKNPDGTVQMIQYNNIEERAAYLMETHFEDRDTNVTWDIHPAYRLELTRQINNNF